ncbi:hypothetical protein U1Q18_040836 [Sarracenia purpurea var. burkii]
MLGSVIILVAACLGSDWFVSSLYYIIAAFVGLLSLLGLWSQLVLLAMPQGWLAVQVLDLAIFFLLGHSFCLKDKL